MAGLPLNFHKSDLSLMIYQTKMKLKRKSAEKFKHKKAKLKMIWKVEQEARTL